MQFTVSLQFEPLPDDENLLIVYGNEELLVVAVKNIVSNACKYSSDHKAIIRFEANETQLLIHVEDNGIGIPSAQIENIYQPFYRVDESRATEGFGLGLSLAERIIKLHKGIIQVHSTPGKGSRFTIILRTNRS